mgnify:CR=1 FL=1
MRAVAPLLCCPRCATALSAETRCDACGAEFAARAGYVDFIAEGSRSERAREVTAFYVRNPFPGYAPSDDATTLLERSRRSPFLVELDRAIAPDATVLDCGCGTGQLAAFLALAAPRRRVVGVDACPASLAAAAAFKERARIAGLSHYLCDLFRLPLAAGAFDVVISRGVVVPAGAYSYDTLNASYSLAQQRMVSGTVSASYGSFYDGTRTTAGYSGRVGLSPHLAVEPSLTFNWVRLPYGDFNASLIGMRFVVSPSSRLGFSSLTQFNPSAHSLASSVRMRWEYAPGSDLYVVYDGLQGNLPGRPELRSNQLVVKMTYLLVR